MWPTTSGLRQLIGDEAKLFRGAIGMMTDQLIAELRQETDQNHYQIHWFDGWDVEQRFWLLDQVANALLTGDDPLEPAAIFEAAVDAILIEVCQLVEIEIDEPGGEKSWRANVINAFVAQNHKPPNITRDCTDAQAWHRVITQVGDAILGVRLYQQAESFRDREIQATQAFLVQKGLPDDFLEKIPPMVSIDKVQRCIDRVQSLVFD